MIGVQGHTGINLCQFQDNYQTNKQERNIIANVAIELMDATGVLAITTFFNQSIGSFHGAKSDRPSVRSLFW